MLRVLRKRKEKKLRKRNYSRVDYDGKITAHETVRVNINILRSMYSAH